MLNFSVYPVVPITELIFNLSINHVTFKPLPAPPLTGEEQTYLSP
jgi:hypothetical protein